MQDEKSGARFVGYLGTYIVMAIVAGLLGYATCAESQEPSVVEDAAWVAGGAVIYELGANALNVTEWHRGRAYSWPDPFQAPTSDYGCLPWCESEISHYVSWAALGAGMTLRGHDPLKAWALSGGFANLWWEFVVETTYTRPSGHDLMINAGSAAVGVAATEAIEAIF